MAFEQLQKLLATQLNLDVSKVTLQSRIMEDLGADSLEVVEMLIGMEEEFGITIPDEEAVNLKTVQDIVNYVDASKKK